MYNIQIGMSATLLSRGVSLTANILGTDIMEQFIGILHRHLLIPYIVSNLYVCFSSVQHKWRNFDVRADYSLLYGDHTSNLVKP